MLIYFIYLENNDSNIWQLRIFALKMYNDCLEIRAFLTLHGMLILSDLDTMRQPFSLLTVG